MEYRFDQNVPFHKLVELASKAPKYHLKSRFKDDANRCSKFSLEWEDIYMDFSKQLIDEDIWQELLALAEEAGVQAGIKAMFSGERINETENRAVLHTALRDEADAERFFDGKNVMPDVHEVLRNMEQFTQAVHDGQFLGAGGDRIQDVVSIGIGGSDLGPVMVSEALKSLPSKVNVHYVSNVDGFHLENTLKHLEAKSTLFIVVSKTFTTQETMTNAEYAKNWLVERLGDDAIAQHFAAVSTNIAAAEDFGISEKNVFGFWDWVGGRYSLWGAVGLSIMMEYGAEVFGELLAGARAMDKHFQTTESAKNLPIVLALIGIWNSNFLEHRSLAILPYAQGLHRFPAFLQQADMESNGKQCNKKGEKIKYQTGPVIWGEAGTNGQHAFYQLIHQGTQIIPADFIGFAAAMSRSADHHEKLMANFIAQSEALMNGLTKEEVMADLEAQGLDNEAIEKLLPFKIFEGNRPSTSILFNELNPRSLGMLIAMYEHKIFVQGWIWDVYSFDQWGVELGKKLAKRILPQIQGGSSFQHDSSTSELIRRCQQKRSQ